MNTRFNAAISATALAMVTATSSADSLTGAINYVSTSNGGASNVEYWNTIDTDNTSFNLYLTDVLSPTSNSDVLNPNGTALNYSLGLGTHDLIFIASNGPFIDTRQYFTLNLFFDGSTNPGISAIWNSYTDTFEGAATSSNTRREDGSTGAASGGLSYQGNDGNTITLTSLTMLHQPGTNIVGGFTDTPDGFTDQFTSFTLEVTPVPVPAAVWLFGSGLLGLVGVARRKR